MSDTEIGYVAAKHMTVHRRPDASGYSVCGTQLTARAPKDWRTKEMRRVGYRPCWKCWHDAS